MKITHKNYNGGISKNYKQYLQQVKKQYMKHNEDYLHVNFGYEGSGKSTLLIHTAKTLDPNYNVSKQTPYTQQQFTKTIDSNQPGQAVLVDEGAEFFYRRDAMKSENRTAIKKLKKCRERNQAILTNLPQPQDLDKAIWPRVQAVTFCRRRPKGHFILWCGKKTIAEIKQLALKHKNMTEIKKEVEPDAKLRFKKIQENTDLWQNYQNIKAEGTTDNEEDNKEERISTVVITDEFQKKENRDKLRYVISESNQGITIKPGKIKKKYTEISEKNKEISTSQGKEVRDILMEEVDLEQLAQEKRG